MNIRPFRKLARMTLDELGARTRIDPGRLSRLERNFGRPSERERRELSRVLAVPPEILFRGSEDNKGK